MSLIKRESMTADRRIKYCWCARVEWEKCVVVDGLAWGFLFLWPMGVSATLPKKMGDDQRHLHTL